MLWKDFYADVALEANKGTTLDAIIPTKVFAALRSIEQNASYRWNERLLTLEVDQNPENPHVLMAPGDLKSIIALKASREGWGKDSIALEELPPQSFNFGSTREPRGYWLQGNKAIWFDAALEPGTQIFLWYNSFTDKQRMHPDLEHPMLEYGYNALLAYTMMNLAAFCREPAWLESYGALAQTAITTLAIADEELRRTSKSIIFGGGYE